MVFHPTRIRWLRQLICWLVACVRPEEMKTQAGFKLWVPRQDRSIYVVDLFATGYYEKRETLLVQSLLTRGDTAVDVGANVGYYTCLFSRLVGETGSVYSFEPVGANLAALRRNIELNQLSNVAVLGHALGDTTSTGQIHLSLDNCGAHSLVGNAVDGAVGEEIDVRRFDDVIPEEAIRLVKMDVEGYELSALLGMRGVLDKKLIQYLLVEFTPYKIDMNNQLPVTFLECLDSYDAEVRVVSNTIDRDVCEIEDIRRDLDRLKRDRTASFNLLVNFSI